MTRLLALLASLAASTLLAAPAFQIFEPFPLTNTRYEDHSVDRKLVANGNDVFIVWSDSGGVKFRKLGAAGNTILGRPIVYGSAPAIVWTGKHFIVASRNHVRLLDAQGVPTGVEVAPIPYANGFALATNGRNALMMATSPATRAYVLTLQGAVTSAEQVVDPATYPWMAAVASNGTGYASIHSDPNGNRIQITTFDADGMLRTRQDVGSHSPRSVVIASDGRDYLAIWSDGDRVQDGGDGKLHAVRVQSDGTMTPFVLATAPSGDQPLLPASLVWTGTRYALAMNAGAIWQFRSSRVAFISREGVLNSTTTLDGTAYNYPSLAIANGHLLAAWGSDAVTNVRDLTAPLGDRAFTTLTANPQGAFRAVSGNDSTLLLWSEDPGWHMGVRRNDGSWSERALPNSISQRIATDGRGFVVAAFNGYTGVATYYESDGTPRWSNVAIPVSVDDILWNGREFIITGTDASGILKAVRLSASGAVSPAVRLASAGPLSPGWSQLATDGRNILVVYRPQFVCVQPCTSSGLLYGLLLDRDLNPLASSFFIGDEGYLDRVALIWDGTQYFAIYSASPEGASGVFARRISQEGVPDPNRIELTRDADRAFSIASTKFGTAVMWPALRNGAVVDEVRFIAADGSVSPAEPFGSGSNGLLVALSGGRLAHITLGMLEPEPYFGGPRIMMEIADVVPPARIPDAPQISVTLDADQKLRVQWTAPPQPVTGYRVEYKAANQDWMELEAWFRPGERSLVVKPAGDPATYAFRVRAWSDSGTSAYSAPASLPAKRRSVR